MKISLSLLAIGLMLFASLLKAPAQGTAFYYQGRLTYSTGSPATGSYDFIFALCTSSNAEAYVGPSLTNSAVSVTNGWFSVLLDFGQVFDGTPRWLQINVSTNGAGIFDTLTPLQQLTPTPYAITASNALIAATISGQLPSASLAGSYAGAVSFNNGSNTFSGTFIGNGAGLTNLPAQNITGSLALAQMPSGVVTNLVIATVNGLTNAVRANGSTVTVTLGTTNSSGTNVSVNVTNFAAIVVTNMVLVGDGSSVVPAQLSQRDLGGFPQFPVVDLRPALANYPLSFDLMPNMTGTKVPPVSSEGLITWFDVCDYDCSTNDTGPVGTARVGITGSYALFGSAGYDGGVAKPLWFAIGAYSAPVMTLSNSYGAYITSETVGGVTLDGTSEPAYVLRTNGTTVAYLGAATSSNNFFSGSLPGDIALRANVGERILMGIGPNTDAAALIISTNGNVSIGTNAATAMLNVGGNTVLGGNLQVASSAVFNGGISLGSGAQFSGNGGGLTNLPFAQTFSSTNGYFRFTQNSNGSTNVTFVVTNVAGATGAGGTNNAQPASSNLTALAVNNGGALTNLPFAETFASTNGYFSFTQNSNGSTNVTFVVTNVVGAIGAGGTNNAQPASSNLTALASNNGGALTNLPFAETFASTNGYFSFTQNSNGSTNVTFVVTNVVGAFGAGGTNNAQPASSNLTALAGNNGGALTNLPFAKTFSSTNGYFSFAQNPDGSTNVTFVFTNGSATQVGAQPASSNLTVLAANNGTGLTNLPFAKTFNSTNGYFSFAQNPDGSTNVTFVLTNVTVAIAGAQPISTNLTMLAADNGAGLTNLPFAKTFASPNGYFSFAQNPDGSTNVTFVLANLAGVTNISYLLTNVTPAQIGAQPASSNLTVLAAYNGVGLTNLPFAETFASTNGYFSFGQNPDGSTNVTFVVTNVVGATGAGGTGNGQPASSNLTALASNNGGALTNLPFAETFASTNGYFSFAKNPDGSTNVTFVVTNVLGATGAGGAGNAQPASSNLTALASNNGGALTNLPFAKTFASPNGYFSFIQNPDGSTNVTFIFTNGSATQVGAQPASSNLTVLAANNGVALTNLPFAKTFNSTNGYFTFTQNLDGSTNVTFVFTNGSAAQVGAQPVSSNLTVLASNNGIALTNLPFAETFASTNGYFSFAQNPNGSTNVTFVVTNVVGATGAGGTGSAQPASSNLTALASNNGGALTNLPFAKTFSSTNGYYTFTQNADGSTNVVFVITNVTAGVAGVQVASSNLTALANNNGGALTNLPFAKTFASPNGYFSFAQNPDGSTNVTFVFTNGSATQVGAQPASSNLTVLAANNGIALTNLPFAKTFNSTNGYFTFAQNPDGSTNVTFVFTNGSAAQVGAQPVSSNLTVLASNNGIALTNLPFAETFASTNGYFSFVQNPNGSTNVTFVVTNVVGATGAGGTGNGQPASSNLTALANNNGGALTNLPFAKTFSSTNGYYTFTQNTDGSTNVAFVITNVAAGVAGAQVASSNLTVLAAGNGGALTNLVAQNITGSLALAQMPSGVVTNLVIATVNGLTNAVRANGSTITVTLGTTNSNGTNVSVNVTNFAAIVVTNMVLVGDGSSVVPAQLSQRDLGGFPQFPVVDLRPALANYPLSFDLMPNMTGTKVPPVSSEGLITWFDVCDYDCSTNDTGPVGTARVGITGSYALFGSAGYDGGVAKPLWFAIGAYSAPVMTLSNSYGAYITSETVGGVTLDGTSEPAYVLRTNGTTVAYLGAATSSNNFFSGSLPGDIALRANVGERILMGIGPNTDAAALIISTNGNVSIGTNAATAMLNVGGNTVLGGNLQVASSAVFNGGISLGSGAQFSGNGGGLTNLPFAQTFSSTNGYFRFTQNFNGSTNVTFVVTNVVGAIGAGGTNNAQPASSNLTALAANNGGALTNLPFAETFASTNGYFSFTQNSNGSTNVTFVVTNVVGAIGAGGTNNAQPASSNLTALASNNGGALTNLPFAKTFSSANGYFSFAQNPDGSTNVTFVFTNGSATQVGAQPASSNLTVLAANNGTALTNLPFAKTFNSINGYFTFTQNLDGSTNVTFIFTNGTPGQVGAQPASANLTALAANNGSALTNLPFAETFVSTNGYFSFTPNPNGSTNVTFVVTNVVGAVGAAGTGSAQPASSNLTALAANNGAGLTNLPFAKTFSSPNGYFSFVQNPDGSTNVTFVLTNGPGVTNITYTVTNVTPQQIGAQPASSNLTALAAYNGAGLTNLPFAETFASTNGYFSFGQNPDGSTNVTFVVTNVAGATGAGGTGNAQPASTNLTMLAADNGAGLTNLPFAKTFASPNGYFSFAQNSDGSTNVTFMFTNGTPGQVGAQPASSNLTILANNNGAGLTNLPFAETFASTNGYFSFTQNPNGSTNVTFVVTNVVGATGAGGTGNAQPASSNLTVLASNNGGALTNLPFAKTFSSTNGYYTFTQNVDGSTNVVFVITNVAAGVAGAQVASSNLTVLAAGNGASLTNLLAQNITGSLALTQMPSGVVTNLVFVTVNGLTNAVRANGSTVTVTLGATSGNGTNVTVGVTNFAAIVVTNMVLVGDGNSVVPAQLSQRDLGAFPEFPVVDLRPALANYPLALDLMPNMAGTTVPPVSEEGLITWFDVCDYDCSTNDTGPVGTARVGITDGYALFGSAGYDGGVAKPLWFAIGAYSAPVMTLSNSYGAYITSETVGGVTLDGTYAPAYVLRTNGTTVAYLGAATSGNQWFSGSMPGDIVLDASAGRRILMGFQPDTDVPALIISANGNISIGTNASTATLNVGGNTSISGTVQANNGFASSATSTATIGGTGWTNTFGINATVYVLGGTSAALSDQNGVTMVRFSPNPTNLTVLMHPLWQLTGTGLTGVAVTQ